MTDLREKMKKRFQEAMAETVEECSDGSVVVKILDDDKAGELSDIALTVIRDHLLSDEVMESAIKEGRYTMNVMTFGDDGYESNDELWEGIMKAALTAAVNSMKGES